MLTKRPPNFRDILMASAGLVLLAACGGGDESETDETSQADAEMTAAAEEVVESTPLEIPAAPPNPLIAANKARSDAYLAENAARDDVRVLETGLQIQTLTAGEGELPTETDFLRFHFTGSFIDGDVFEDSRPLGDPIVVRSYVGLPLPGVPEALSQMREGETARVVLPPDLAFGEEGLPGLIEPNEVLIFDVELIEVVTEAEEDRRAEIIAEQERLAAEARAQAEAAQAEARAAFEEIAAGNRAASTAFLAEVRAREGILATDTGLLYEVVEDGGSGTTPDPWDEVTVHYRGTLPDGTTFDSSYDRGQPTSFPLNRVIAGWTEGVGLMNVGDTYRFYIPSDLAYGTNGAGQLIGPNQALVFDVELLEITENEAPAAPAPENE